MKRLYIFLLFAAFGFANVSQAQDNDYLVLKLNNTDSLTQEQQEKMNVAFAALDLVQQTGNYIESLSELLTSKIIPLPIGIKSEKNGYELIIHKIYLDKQTGKQRFYATCAFTIKSSGQKIAFEGEATLESIHGLGSVGRLTIIAPIKFNIGRESAIVIREGTGVSFSCGNIDDFDAKLAWVTTSDKIIAIDNQGLPTNRPLGIFFDANFNDFDNYILSLNINQRFMFKGLDDVFFSLKGIVIDQSDIENAGTMQFPQNYFSPTMQSNPDLINLWRGVAISEALVALPSFYKKPNSDGTTSAEPIVLSLRQALFDENGFTGNIAAENIIPNETIDPAKWGISLTGVGIGIQKNRVESFALTGAMNIPPFGKNSLLPYTAYFNPVEERYAFSVNVGGDYEFPALKSTLSLSELSSISIEYRNKELYPKIDATGTLTVKASVTSDTSSNDSEKSFSVPGISFEHLIISREAPYVQIGYIGITSNLQSPSIAGFTAQLSDIKSFQSPDGDGLSFTGGIALNTTFSGSVGVKLFGDYSKWKFNRVSIDKVNVDFQSKAFSLKGGVWFKNGDAIYGNGFRGDLSLNIINKFTFEAVGVFGKKDDYRYFLADVFFESSAGLPVPPVLKLTGFGGGLYHHMQQSEKAEESLPAGSNISNLDFGRSLSGIKYLPDKNVGLGLMSSAKFASSASEKAFNFCLGFEIQFSSTGGLNFVQLRGDAAFMDTPEKLGSLADNISKKVAKQKQSGELIPEKKSIGENDVPENKSRSMLSASVLLEYDAINNQFNGNMNAYANIADVIKGIGPNDRLGWTSILISEDNWYIYAGTPSQPLGIKVLGFAQLTSYFMLGNGIPALPPPPQRVLNMLSAEKREQLNSRKEDKLGAGTGFAFGSSLQINFEPSFAIFYAKMSVGLGSEFMLTSLGGAFCEGVSGEPGINGWYAQGQAWAYVDAGIGLQAKIFGEQRRFEILDLGVATLLQGKGPNPFYFSGSVGGRYSILGGLIKGQCSFDFEIGKECKLVQGGSPFGENVIAELTPAGGAKDISVFAAPQVLFNIPVNMSMTIDEQDGRKGTYMIKLVEFSAKYKDNNVTVSGEQKTNNDGTVVMLKTKEPFQSQKDVVVYAKVNFQKKNGNNWEDVKDSKGNSVYEEKSIEFKTGDRPKEILKEHVKYSYPLSRQYNYYPDETNEGYLLLSQNYSYLFSDEKPEGFVQKLRISTVDGENIEKNFTYKTINNISDVTMEINFPINGSDLGKDKIYKLSIVNIPQNNNIDMTSNVVESTKQVEGVTEGSAQVTTRYSSGTLNQLKEKEIYSLNFKTSHYSTFADKMSTFEKQNEGWRDYVEPYVHFVKQNLIESELFDAYEMGSSNVSDTLIHFTANINQTNWYTQTIYKKMYEKETYMPAPVRSIQILTGTPYKLLTDDEITTNLSSGYNTEGIIRYELSPACYRDLQNAKTNIAMRTLNRNMTQDETTILATSFPPTVFKGNYPVTVSYTLPGKKIATTTMSFNIYNPVEP